MALIGEADFERDVGKGPVRFLEQFAGDVDSPLQNVLMRRLSRALLEGPVEMPWRQSGDGCQIFRSQFCGQVSLDVLAHATQGTRRKAAARERISWLR